MAGFSFSSCCFSPGVGDLGNGLEEGLLATVSEDTPCRTALSYSLDND